MSTPLVSIIMPAFNGGIFIEQAINSVLKQTYSDWELIVVDDGSTDDTATIVAGYDDDRIRYIYQENRGQASALNRGLQLARGDYITTLDTDDWFTPNSLSDRVIFLEINLEFDVVYGYGVYCDVKGEPLKTFSQYRLGNATGDVYEVIISTPFFGTGGNVMVCRKVLDQNNIQYDEEIFWCQDWDFYTRIAEHGKFGCVDKTVMWYRIHKENMTMAPHLSDQRIESLMKMKSKIMKSPSFSTISPASKYSFFFSLLSAYLFGRKDDQIQLFNSEQFKSIPKKQQAELYRFAAGNHIFMGRNFDFAQELLNKAQSLNPYDIKTASIYILLKLYPKLAVLIMKYWRKSKSASDNSACLRIGCCCERAAISKARPSVLAIAGLLG